MTLGQRIQEQRKAVGLSQEQLGEKLGVSRQAISKWEADGAVPEVDKLIALGRLFQITLNELLQVDCPAGTAEEEEQAATEYAIKARRRRIFKNGGHILTGVLVLALIASVALLWVRLDALEKRVGETAQTVETLDPAALVAAWDFRVETQDGSGTVLYVSVTPAVAVEGMTVSFQATGTDMEACTTQARETEGTFYSALLTLPEYSAPAVSVIFEVGGVRYVQPLADFETLTETSSSWNPLWEGK